MESNDTQPDPMMPAEPQAEHQWLQKFVGEWRYAGGAVMDPDKPAEKWEGSESVRTLGGFWILAEGHGEMPGCGPATTIMTLGYDARRQRYVGSWIGSMMPQFWLYDGELDRGANVLTLHSEGPHMTIPGKTAKYRDVIEFKSDDHRVMTSHMQDDDGTWQKFMKADYWRKK